ncbi:hypothetical protein WOLCODRAFT_101465 [Wolfiporia cocos MD-104 SS10]|uniref:Ctf8-domain-containing protein n=1 Tax=Wolfiporia cocos (strain MD-104) TaxID=742152 RepID=A0A2H3JZ89_WOLCO|nr:hypothetical protein WOLCODRAFT_101465 [Wolfiporia cocos MD-104 SS10]
MIIPIGVAPSSSESNRAFPPQLVQFGSDEYVLIELQGSLEVEGNKDGQVVGRLRVDEASKKPTLLIGHHLLEGKLVNLPKPLAIMHRSMPRDHDSDQRDILMDGGLENRRSTQAQSRWDIVAVVKRKMVFPRRPMPMVGRVASLPQTEKR